MTYYLIKLVVTALLAAIPPVSIPAMTLMDIDTGSAGP